MKGMTCFENKIMAGALTVSLILTSLALPVSAIEEEQKIDCKEDATFVEALSEKDINDEYSMNDSDDNLRKSISLDYIFEEDNNKTFDEIYNNELEEIHGESDYMIDTEHRIAIGQVKVIPDSYWADFYFVASTGSSDICVLYSEDKNVDWKSEATYITEKGLNNIHVATFENRTCSYDSSKNWGWKELSCENYGRLYGKNDFLNPLTEYQYRLVYRKCVDYETEGYRYYFLTNPSIFTTIQGRSESGIKFSEISIQNGYAYSDVSYTIVNPDDEKIVKTYFKGKDEDGTEIYKDLGYYDWDDEYKRRIYGSKKVVGNLVAVTYLGENAEETEVLSDEITIVPFSFNDPGIVSVETTPLGGGVIFDICFNVAAGSIDIDKLDGKLYYKRSEMGTNSFISEKIYTSCSYDNGFSFVVNELLDEQAYDYYIELSIGEDKLSIGSRDKSRSFVTRKNLVYYYGQDFSDIYFYRYLLKEYGKTDGDESNLSDIDLNTIRYVKYKPDEKAALTSLKGIEYLSFLQEAYFGYNNITDITGIEKLKYLKNLDLSFNELKSIPDLSVMNKLKVLRLDGNKLTSDSLLENRIPDSVKCENEEYIRSTLSKQIGNLTINMEYPDFLYQIDDSWPFLVKCADRNDGILSTHSHDTKYCISIEQDGKVISSDYVDYSDRTIWQIPDLKQSGISLKLGENKFKLSLSEKYGHKLYEEDITVVYLKDMDIARKLERVSTETSYVVVKGIVKGIYSDDDITDIKLFRNDGKEYKINPRMVSATSADYDCRYSQFATVYTAVGKEEMGYLEMELNELRRDNTILQISMDIEDKLELGKYDVSFLAGDKEVYISNVLEVFNTAQKIILEEMYPAREFDQRGEYIYYKIEGSGPIPDHVWPVIGSIEKPYTEKPEAVIPYEYFWGEYTYLYKLPKVKEKWDHFVPGKVYSIKRTFDKSDPDISVINNIYTGTVDANYFTGYKVDEIITFDYYNEKKDELIAFTTGYVPEGSTVSIEVIKKSDNSKILLKSQNATVKDGILEYKLISDTGEIIKLSEDEEYYFNYSFAAEPLDRTYYSYSNSFSYSSITYVRSDVKDKEIDTIAIYRPTCFEPIRELKVGSGQKEYYFTSDDLLGLDLNDLYEVLAIDKNGLPISYRKKAYLDVEQEEKGSSSSAKSSSSSSGKKDSSSSSKKDSSSSDKKDSSSSTFPVTPDPYIPVNLDSDNMQHIEVKTGIKNIDGSSDILSIDTVKYVAYNGKKHVSPFDKVSKSAVGDVVVNVHGNITKDGTIKLKFKNNKTAWVSGRDNTESKRPYFILSFKPDKGIDKETKQQIKLVNASLKNKPIYFDIKPIDISKGRISINTDKSKMKVTKVEISIDGKTYKLSKKDYDIKFTEGEYVIVTGKRNFTGTKMANK